MTPVFLHQGHSDLVRFLIDLRRESSLFANLFLGGLS